MSKDLYFTNYLLDKKENLIFVKEGGYWFERIIYLCMCQFLYSSEHLITYVTTLS